MAANFKVVGPADGTSGGLREKTFDVVSGAAASISDGDLVIVDGSNPGYVSKAANGASSTASWVGLAAGNSTDTAAADGLVQVLYHPSGILVKGTAATPANLAQAVINTKVTLDVAAGVQTIDENDTASGVLTMWRPEQGASAFDTTNGKDTVVKVPFNL